MAPRLPCGSRAVPLLGAMVMPAGCVSPGLRVPRARWHSGAQRRRRRLRFRTAMQRDEPWCYVCAARGAFAARSALRARSPRGGIPTAMQPPGHCPPHSPAGCRHSDKPTGPGPTVGACRAGGGDEGPIHRIVPDSRSPRYTQGPALGPGHVSKPREKAAAPHLAVPHRDAAPAADRDGRCGAPRALPHLLLKAAGAMLGPRFPPPPSPRAPDAAPRPPAPPPLTSVAQRQPQQLQQLPARLAHVQAEHGRAAPGPRGGSAGGGGSRGSSPAHGRCDCSELIRRPPAPRLSALPAPRALPAAVPPARTPRAERQPRDRGVSSAGGAQPRVLSAPGALPAPRTPHPLPARCERSARAPNGP